MLTLAQVFPHIRVLNLPDRADRLRACVAQLAALGSPLCAGSVEVYAGVRPAEAAGFPSPGTRGCFLSHLGALKEAYARGVESVLVLEDDLEVLAADRPRLSRLLAEMPATWAFLYLGHLVRLPAEAPGFLRFDGPLQTAHCYAVHGSALADLIDYLEACLVRPPGDPVGGPMHLDGALTMYRAAHPELTTWIALPSLVRQRSSRSDIALRPLEQVPGVRQAFSAARALAGRLRQAGTW